MARDEPEWPFNVPPRLQTIENSMAETLKRFESTFTSLQRSEASKSDRLRTVEASLATSSSTVEDRRRSSVGLVKRGSVTDISAGDLPLLAKVLGRLQSVEASLASLPNSSDGERAAEDVEERLQAIEGSLAAPKPALDERRRSTLERIKRMSMACFVREEPARPAWLAGVPDRLQSLESLDADEERLRAIETSQTSVYSGVEVKNAGDSDALTGRPYGSAFSASVSVEAKSWALAKGSYSVVRLLGGRGAQDGVVRVVALQAVAATSDC